MEMETLLLNQDDINDQVLELHKREKEDRN